MSRKTLLTEAEVRQFLKLANIGPVGDAKVVEMYQAKRDDEEIEEDKEDKEDDEDKKELKERFQKLANIIKG